MFLCLLTLLTFLSTLCHGLIPKSPSSWSKTHVPIQHRMSRKGFDGSLYDYYKKNTFNCAPNSGCKFTMDFLTLANQKTNDIREDGFDVAHSLKRFNEILVVTAASAYARTKVLQNAAKFKKLGFQGAPWDLVINLAISSITSLIETFRRDADTWKSNKDYIDLIDIYGMKPALDFRMESSTTDATIFVPKTVHSVSARDWAPVQVALFLSKENVAQSKIQDNYKLNKYTLEDIPINYQVVEYEPLGVDYAIDQLNEDVYCRNLHDKVVGGSSESDEDEFIEKCVGFTSDEDRPLGAGLRWCEWVTPPTTMCREGQTDEACKDMFLDGVPRACDWSDEIFRESYARNKPTYLTYDAPERGFSASSYSGLGLGFDSEEDSCQHTERGCGRNVAAIVSPDGIRYERQPDLRAPVWEDPRSPKCRGYDPYDLWMGSDYQLRNFPDCKRDERIPTSLKYREMFLDNWHSQIEYFKSVNTDTPEHIIAFHPKKGIHTLTKEILGDPFKKIYYPWNEKIKLSRIPVVDEPIITKKSLMGDFDDTICQKDGENEAYTDEFLPVCFSNLVGLDDILSNVKTWVEEGESWRLGTSFYSRMNNYTLKTAFLEEVESVHTDLKKVTTDSDTIPQFCCNVLQLMSRMAILYVEDEIEKPSCRKAFFSTDKNHYCQGKLDAFSWFSDWSRANYGKLEDVGFIGASKVSAHALAATMVAKSAAKGAIGKGTQILVKKIMEKTAKKASKEVIKETASKAAKRFNMLTVGLDAIWKLEKVSDLFDWDIDYYGDYETRITWAVEAIKERLSNTDNIVLVGYGEGGKFALDVFHKLIDEHGFNSDKMRVAAMNPNFPEYYGI